MTIMRQRKMYAVGLLLAAVYFLVAQASFRSGLVPGKPLYDGLAPPEEYRWVKPPTGASSTLPPEEGNGTVTFTATASSASQIVTKDAQAQLIIPEAGIKSVAGQTEAVGTIKPLDPAADGRKPLPGLDFDSNAYVVEMHFGNGQPVELVKPASLVIRYAAAGIGLYQLDESSWKKVEAAEAGASLQYFAEVQQLGTFVVMRRKVPKAAPVEDDQPTSALAQWGLGIAGAVVLGGLVFAYRRSKRKSAVKSRPGARRAPAKRPRKK